MKEVFSFQMVIYILFFNLGSYRSVLIRETFMRCFTEPSTAHYMYAPFLSDWRESVSARGPLKSSKMTSRLPFCLLPHGQRGVCRAQRPPHLPLIPNCSNYLRGTYNLLDSSSKLLKLPQRYNLRILLSLWSFYCNVKITNFWSF